MTAVEAVRENVAEAYLSLAQAAPGAKLANTERFSICTSELRHPIANFALRLDVDQVELDYLIGLTHRNPYFRLHLMNGDRPAGMLRVAEKAGLTAAYCLVSLVHDRGEGTPDVDFRRLTGKEVGRAVDFVIEVFFRSSPAAIRRELAKIAVQTADRHAFFGLTTGDEIVAVGTLIRSESAIGIYNVAVREADRRRGIGAALVRHLVSEASRELCPLVLQCEPGLVDWYRRLGFRDVGESIAMMGPLAERSAPESW